MALLNRVTRQGFVLFLSVLVAACQTPGEQFVGGSPIVEKPADYFALCYHDVRNDVEEDLDPDQAAVKTEYLPLHFEWLKQHGYTPVSLDEIEAARQGKSSLPEKAVLLTFDDGYSSFYHKIYPLLKLYDYPAVFGLVTRWMEVPEGGEVLYGDEVKRRSDFLTWEQVREMQGSGLIEIASHSHNLHRGIVGNPQGNVQAAAVTRQYANGSYESDSEYHRRIFKDFSRSAEIIEKRTGQRPRTLVWPYGRYSNDAWQLARKAGYQHSLVLDQGKNRLDDGPHINRHLISGNPTPSEFRDLFQAPERPSPHRVVHVDLDYLYDPDPVQQHKNLSALVSRIYKMEVSAVYLQAFADPDGDGNANSVYFPNRHLPVRADLFNRVSWQLQTRANVEVYAWMPVTAFDFGESRYREWGVYSLESGDIAPSTANYRRLSIFSPEAGRVIKEIYADLGRYAAISGLVFHDDAYLSDYEDVRPEALKFYRQHGLDFDDPQDLRHDAEMIMQWAKVKTSALTDFTIQLSEVVKHYRPDLKVARNLYARPVIEPESEQWFAQSLENAVSSYDITAIMAMPYMEGASNPKRWLQQLMTAIEKTGLPKQKVLLELQARKWHRDNQYVPAEELAQSMRDFRSRGFLNYGYYPDDFIEGHPAIEVIRPEMALTDYPFMRR